MKTPNLESTMGLKKTIITTLNSIGVPTNLLGYDYLKTGLEMVLNKPDLIRQVTQVLYPSIAVEHNTTSARVERTIRHAIEVVYERDNFEVLEKIAGVPSYSRGKLTNSEFLSNVAEHIRMEMGAYD